MSAPRPPSDRSTGRVLVVHLTAAEYEDERVRASWHGAGYSTLPFRAGHPLHERCPICSDHDPHRGEQ